MTQLVKIDVVAEKLNASVENVQQLVRGQDTKNFGSKALREILAAVNRQIPVVRLSRKLWRFDLQKVEAAVAKLEIRTR